MPSCLKLVSSKRTRNMGNEAEPRLSGKERLIVELLIAHGELYGQELVKRSDGSLARGTVYVTLDRLEDKGFVKSRLEEKHPGSIGLPRRMYEVTGLGRRVLEALEIARLHMVGNLLGGG